MDENLDLDLGGDETKELISRKDKKINSLSEKLGLTEKEKADAAAKAEAEAQARAEAEKERDFFKSFNTLSSKYQGAQDYQEKIWEKVKSGYDMEDAAISILAKEGKYTAPVAPVEQAPAAGGSASTGIADVVDKTPDKMTQAERLSVLREMESKGEFRL